MKISAPKQETLRHTNWLLRFFERLSDRIALLGEAATVNIYTIILLIIVYLFYWRFPQAKDLLLTINQESHAQIFFFFTSLVTLAGICWYMPRYFYKEIQEECRAAKTWKQLLHIDMEKYRIDYKTTKESDFTENSPEGAALRQKYFNERVPRILSTAMLLLVTLGILNVGHEISIEESNKFPWNISAYRVAALLGGAYLLNLLLGNITTSFRFNQWVEQKLGRWVLVYFVLVGIVLVILMRTKKGGIDDLAYLLLMAFLLSISFLVFAICRKNIPFLKIDSNIKYPVVALAIACSLFFVLINCMPRISQEINPLVCANLAFVFYLTILYAVRFWGLRHRISAVLFLLVTIVVINSFTSSRCHHEIRYLKNVYNPGERETLETYFKTWVDCRRDSIMAYLSAHPGGTFPVLIVSAEGGGSRAAYWTSRVHGYLENQIPGYYSNHLFAMTGASGGTTGNSTFFALKQGGVASENLKEASEKMFKTNYLSSSLTLFLGADLTQEVLGISLGSNRAKQLEHEWSNKLDNILVQGHENVFKEPFLKPWYDENSRLKPGAKPLLFINTTQVQGAGHAIFSPVRLAGTTYRGMDILDTLYTINKGKTIPLVTANLLNASFPYINPAGQIDSVGSFVDAGYFDNYGARAAAAMLKELSDIKSKEAAGDSIYQKINFVSVLIRNGTADQDKPSAMSNDIYILSSQLLAPISTIGNIRSAVNDHNFWDLRHAANAFFLIDLKRVPAVTHEGDRPVTPIIPLARYLSPLAIKAMEASLDSLADNETSDLTRLVKVLK